MKINEIIEPQHVDRQVSTDIPAHKFSQRVGKQFTDTAYAHGVEDPQDPHLYRKKIKMPSNLKNDAYYQYIIAASPYMQSNPVFPRVYDIIYKKYPNGQIKPDYRMEKLLPLRTDVFNGIELGKYLAKKYLTSDEVDKLNDIDTVVADIRDCLSPYFFKYHGHMNEVIKDKHLRDALILIKNVIASNSNFELDLHSGNIMLRQSSTGPQLVITDPIQDHGKSIAAGFNPFSGKTVQAPDDDDDDDNNVKYF